MLSRRASSLLEIKREAQEWGQCGRKLSGENCSWASRGVRVEHDVRRDTMVIRTFLDYRGLQSSFWLLR